MRIAVSHRSEDGAAGGRLRDALAGRLTHDTVTSASSGAPFDVLVAVLSADSSLPADADADRVQRALERAVRDRAGIVLVTLEGAAPPAPADLPPALAALADLDPVSASDEYWEATVDRVVERIEQVGGGARRPGLGRRIAALVLRQSRRVKIGGAVGVVAGVLGILVTLGVIDPGPDPEQRGTIEVSPNAANAVTFERYVELFRPGGDVAPPITDPADTEGYVYDVDVALDDPEGDRYELRWTARVADGGTPIAGRRNLVGARLDADAATGVHRLWVPCPPEEFDAVPYVVEFVLVDESRKGRPPLDRADGPRGECLVLGP